MYRTLLLEVKDEIAMITLNRPDANNSFNDMAFAEVTAAIEQCDLDNSVRAVIITGAGKNFSSGGDINEMSTMKFLTYESAMSACKMTGSVRKCSKPVVAMINGSAAGAACALALACDFRVMTEKSALVTAFVNLSLSGDSGCLYHLYHIIGLAKTIEMMMLSAPIKGEDAFKMGLTTRLAPEDKLQEITLEFTKLLINKPTAAIARQKQLFYNTFYHDYDTYCQLESKLFFESSKTEDHYEAVMAFLAKRKPVFKGL